MFNSWREEELHENNLFIQDGIINSKKWDKAEVKILFLLKEAYHSKKDNGLWDLRNHLQNKKAKSRTFRPLGQWANGIQELYKAGDLPKFSNKQSILNKALESSAVVNLKKSGGKKTSSKKDLLRYVDADWEKYTIKQIQEISPTIIICGGTWSLIKPKFAGKERKVSEEIYKYKNLIFVDYFHPAYRIKNRIKYHALNALIKISNIHT
jgi:hypothetical protein